MTPGSYRGRSFATGVRESPAGMGRRRIHGLRRRRKVRPSLFRFHKVDHPQPWVNQVSWDPPAGDKGSHDDQWRIYRALLWLFKAVSRCLCCPSWCCRFSLLEYKYEVTMVFQVWCLLLGIMFLILDAASSGTPDERPFTTTIATTTTHV